MADTGMTAEEAKAKYPGQNINKVCHVELSRTGTVRPLYYDRESAPAAAAAPVAEPEPEDKPKKRGRAKKTQDNGDEAA